MHKLYNEYGTHRVFNNQYGGATTRVCRDADGTDCAGIIEAGTYSSGTLSPANSIGLDPRR